MPAPAARPRCASSASRQSKRPKAEPVRRSLFGLPIRPKHQPEFWTLSLEDQVRLAELHVDRVDQKTLEVVVGELVDDDYTDHSPDDYLSDWLPNAIHAAHALGYVRGLRCRSKKGVGR